MAGGDWHENSCSLLGVMENPEQPFAERELPLFAEREHGEIVRTFPDIVCVGAFPFWVAPDEYVYEADTPEPG